MTDSFSATYAEAREKFLAAARTAGAQLYRYDREDIAGRDGERLGCDVAVLGPENAAQAAIVISGTHGAEAYSASAIQHRWMASQPTGTASSRVKIVLVHAINPWAFSHKTRVTENNVDLNRNFFADATGYQLENAAYDRLAPFLHATSIDASGELANYRAYTRFLEQNGQQLEYESWVGQSRHPEGMFYTGKGPEWSNGTFRQIVRDHLAKAELVGFIDWHTQIGEYGEIVYLLFDPPESAGGAMARRWWGLADGGGSAFRTGAVPKYEGLLCKAIRAELPNAQVTGAVIEIGTCDAYSVFRADRLDRWLSFEGRDDPRYDTLREDYMDLCCPRDLTWRRMVLSAGPAIIDRLIEGVRAGEGRGPA